ncbi:hypothetical protein SBV1_1920004 [Verrucomicrobia bacterium]|nr:hypothetical protein SBV1_1920004 [Verrucomicrobiota bacterium]
MAALDQVMEVPPNGLAVHVKFTGQNGNIGFVVRSAQPLEQLVLAGQPLGKKPLPVAVFD